MTGEGALAIAAAAEMVRSAEKGINPAPLLDDSESSIQRQLREEDEEVQSALLAAKGALAASTAAADTLRLQRIKDDEEI